VGCDIELKCLVSFPYAIWQVLELLLHIGEYLLDDLGMFLRYVVSFARIKRQVVELRMRQQ
jgi:hypothetical protein